METGGTEFVIAGSGRRKQEKSDNQRIELNYTVKTWAEDMATQGCDQSADSAAGNGGAARAAPTKEANLAAKR
jgi:hypothetical protein